MVTDAYIWIVLVIFTSSAFVLVIKYLTLSQQWIYLAAIIAFELLTLVCYYNIFSAINVSTGYGIAKGVSIILVAVAGVVIFHEHLTALNIVGIAVIAVGVTLLAIQR